MAGAGVTLQVTRGPQSYIFLMGGTTPHLAKSACGRVIKFLGVIYVCVRK